MFYERSEERETIQCAWNRGIARARAPYLVFLGVDEMLYPQALEILANELDRDCEVDWVMADSLVTKVNAHGLLQQDVMKYSRANATKDHVYLETCYLSWVGGMYRKNIHDRFGFYDETFRGAGDTEFKNRILPNIRVKFLPQLLGLFCDFPEERTTASPMAEIEDSRAWYIHRTLGGVRYAFENRPEEDLKAQFVRALGYRKSYCGHTSSDFNYAFALSVYGLDRFGGQWWREANDDLAELRGMLVKLDALSSDVITYACLKGMLKRAGELCNAHKLRYQSEALNYTLFNDNRFEQHSWLWQF